MPKPEAEIDVSAMVFVGSFNPTIFQPAWLAAQELIRPEEAENADISVIHPEVVSFSLDWVQVEVTHERCAFVTTTASEAPEPIRDLAVGVFTILKHTPIRALGMNSECHYKIDSEDRWHAIGHLLAPDEYWSDILEQPGMRTLAMQGMRPDGPEGHVRMTVEPSVRVHPGIFFSVNDHYQRDADTVETEGADWALQLIRERWEESRTLGGAVAERILGLA